MNLGFLYVRVGAGVVNYFSSRELRVARHSLMPAVFPPVRVWEGADEMRIENITEMRMNYNNLLGMFSFSN